MTEEAVLEQTTEGLAPGTPGWFVVNARDARWIRRPGRGHNLPFTGWTAEEVEGVFDLLGFSMAVLAPGEPLSMYHWENDQEAYLVIDGEATLLVDGQERPLARWDFVHFPVGCPHSLIGAGEAGCTVVAAGSRVKVGTPDWGAYVPDPVAAKHGIAVEEQTSDTRAAYSRFGASAPIAYGGWLPGD